MKKLQIRIINNDVSSNTVTDYLKHLGANKKIEILFDNGNLIKLITDISASALLNDLHKEFDFEFEVRDVEE